MVATTEPERPPSEDDHSWLKLLAHIRLSASERFAVLALAIVGIATVAICGKQIPALVIVAIVAIVVIAFLAVLAVSTPARGD